MKKILTVIRKEYLERVRSKSFLIGTLLGPLLMSMFIVVPVFSAGTISATALIANLQTHVLAALPLPAATYFIWRRRANLSLGKSEPFFGGLLVFTLGMAIEVV